MNRVGFIVVFVLVASSCCGLTRAIRLPAGATLAGNVVIADTFEEEVRGEIVPRQFQVWPGSRGARPASWFDARIEALRGDVLILEPGEYKAQIWIFAPDVTVMTEPAADGLAVVLGTVEIDADGVTLERIGVTDSSNSRDSGHGIEVNRALLDTVTIRGCRSFGNRWTGIHIVGATGRIREMRVEGCELIDNGMDGMDALSVDRLVVIGCTIVGNGWDMATGVGVRIGSWVLQIEMHDNRIEGNRYADVYHRD
jgi:hypothetical protein